MKPVVVRNIARPGAEAVRLLLQPALLGFLLALGAAAAVKSAGLKGLKITGFDGSPDAVAAITSGEMQATALQPAVVISEMAMNEADAFLKTGSTGKPEMQVIQCDLVTKANAAEYVEFEKVKDSAGH